MCGGLKVLLGIMWKLVVNLMLQPLYPGDSARYQMKMWLDVNHSQFGSFGEEKFLAAAGDRTKILRLFSPSPSHYRLRIRHPVSGVSVDIF